METPIEERGIMETPESPIKKKQRLEHRGEGMEKMPKINYSQPCEIDEEYINRVIEELETDIEMFGGPSYTGNPHMTGVRIALRSMVDALRIGLVLK